MVANEGLRTAVRRALLVAAVSSFAGVTTVHAQQAPANNNGEQVADVIVTGSRIAAPNQTSASPIQVVSQEGIQDTGRADMSDILNQLPQIYNNDIGQDLGNRTSGLTTPGGVA